MTPGLNICKEIHSLCNTLIAHDEKFCHYISHILLSGYTFTHIDYSNTTLLRFLVHGNNMNLIEHPKRSSKGYDYLMQHRLKLCAILLVQELLHPVLEFNAEPVMYPVLKRILQMYPEDQDIVCLLEPHFAIIKLIYQFDSNQGSTYNNAIKILTWAIHNYPISKKESDIILKMDNYIHYFKAISNNNNVSQKVSDTTITIITYINFLTDQQVLDIDTISYIINSSYRDVFADLELIRGAPYTDAENQFLSNEFKFKHNFNTITAQKMLNRNYALPEIRKYSDNIFFHCMTKFISKLMSYNDMARILFIIDNYEISSQTIKLIQSTYVSSKQSKLPVKADLNNKDFTRLMNWMSDNLILPKETQMHFILAFNKSSKYMQYIVDNFRFDKSVLQYALQELQYACLPYSDRLQSDICPRAYNVFADCAIYSSDVYSYDERMIEIIMRAIYKSDHLILE